MTHPVIDGPTVLSILGLLALACASQQRLAAPTAEGQSYAEAIAQICGVDQKLGDIGEVTELELGQMREDFIVENTKNADAIFFVTIWRTKPPAEQASLLNAEANEQKLADCPLAASLAQVQE